MDKKYHHGSLRDAILEAGMELIRKESISSLSLRKIAKDIGVSHMAPYRHFKDKSELVMALIEEGYKLFNMTLASAISDYDDVTGKFSAMTRAYITFALDREDFYRLIFGNSLSKDTYPERLYELSMFAFNLLEDLLKEIYGDGYNRHDALMKWASLHGLIILYLDGKLPREYMQMDLGSLLTGKFES